jgi:hypothetical protein
MVTLFRKFIDAFLHDEMAAKRWIRGGLNFGATIAAQVVIDPAWVTWTFKQWLVHSVPAVVSFFAGTVTAGDKTPANVKELANEIKPGTVGQ